MKYTKRDLIDLAIEYEMVFSALDFNSRKPSIQKAILKQMEVIANQMSWN